MANAARKARKKAGIKIEKLPKEGTPFAQRALRPKSLEHQMNAAIGGSASNRHKRKIEEYKRISSEVNSDDIVVEGSNV